MPDETNAPPVLEIPSPDIQPADTNRPPSEINIDRYPRVVTDPGTAALAPQTASAFAGTGRGAKALGLTPNYEERNVSPGTPLDVESGLTTWDRLQLARRSAERDQFAYLKNKYGDKIRKSDSGEWIVRVPDEATGGEKDIVANPHKLTIGDMGSLMGHAPEVAAWVAGEKGLRAIPALGKMRGIGGLMRDVVGGAAGAETFGTAQDIETRSIEDRAPLDLGEILGRRAGGFVADVAVGTPMAGAARFFNWVRSPFGGLSTDVQFDMVAAQKEFYQKTGILVPLNLAEISGNPDIVRRFRQLKYLPGSAEPMAAFKQRQSGAMKKLQDIIVGTDYADDLRVGKQVMSSVEGKIAPVIEGQATAKTAAEAELEATRATTHLGAMTKGTSEIESLVAGQTLPERLPKAAYVGEMIRNRLVQLRDTAKANVDALYQNFRDIDTAMVRLGGQPAVFPSDDLAKAAKKIVAELPPQFKQTAAGAQVSGPSTAFVEEPSILRRLNELISSEGGLYRFSDLQNMRNAVFDDMAKSEAVPGLDKRYLSKIANILTDAMEQGIDQLQNPALKQALQKANAAYKTELVPFEKKGIAELFANEFENGHVFPGQIVESLTSGPAAADRYNLMKQFLGTDSLEMKALNRHVADSVLSQGQLLGAANLDAKTFLRNMSKFVDEQPEIAEQVFGKKQADLVQSAKTMILADETAKLPLVDVEKLVAEGKATTPALQKLMRAQKALDEKTSNSIIDAIHRKTVTGLDVSAEDIVTRWIPKSSRDELQQLMSMLADQPELVEEMRSLYAQKAFAKGAETGKSVSQIITKAYGDDKGKLILGDKMFEDLQMYGALEKGIKAASGADAGAGLASMSRLDKMMMEPFKFAPQAIREWVTAKILTSDKMRNWALAGKPGEPGNLMLVLSSPPFIQAVSDTFGAGSTAQNFMQTLHQGLGDAFKGFMGQQKRDVEMQKRFEASKPKTMELPTRQFGPSGGAKFVGTNQPQPAP